MLSLRHAGALILTCLLLCPLNAAAWERGEVETFATLPAGNANPEGIAADKQGNIYVTTFAVTAPASQLGRLFVFNPYGQLLRPPVSITGSSHFLLGLDFHPQSGALLVIDFGAKKVLKVDPVTGQSSVFTTIPGGTAAGPNALTFDKDGNVYISDSFQGVIWKTGPNGGPSAVAWVTDPLLKTTGVPGFGANGVGFNKAFSMLFVANTGNDTVVQIPVSGDGTPGTPSVLTNSINGADGLILDDHDNIWVAANQADEIVVIDKTGKAIAKLGDFDGIDKHGAPIGFLFPASLVRFGEWLYVTNLSLDLRLTGNPGPQTVDSQWAAQVTSYTIARLRARIPHVHGNDHDDD
jgi:sugar lactone lactonase YvrE